MEELVCGVYTDFYEETVVANCLAKFGIKSLSKFLKSGLKGFGEHYFNKLCTDIANFEAFDFSLQLLVYGYGLNGTAHLFSVPKPRSVIDHGLLGYAVIGSGTDMALAALTSRPMNDRSLEKIIYRLLEAKFCAETADNVGKTTSVVTRNSKNEIGQMTPGDIEAIRKVWAAEIAKSPPNAATKIIKQSGAVKLLGRPTAL